MKRAVAPRGWRRNSGLSLMEVLSSVALFGVVAMGVSRATISLIRGNTVSRMSTVASSLAYDQIEKFRSLDPETDPAVYGEGAHQDPDNPITAGGEPGGHYYRSWIVSRNKPNYGLAEIVVTLTWKDARQRSLSYATYVCLAEGCA